MIIPSLVGKIIGFKKDYSDSISKESIPGEKMNLIDMQLDSGEVIKNIKILSNDPSFSDDLGEFLESKLQKVIKSNELKMGAMDIIMNSNEYPDIDKRFEEEQSIVSNENPDMNAKKVLQAASESLVNKMIREKRLISSKSIIKLPLAIGMGDRGEYYNSKSIQVSTSNDGEKAFGNGGIYYFSQTSNYTPIEISPIIKSDGSFVGYFKVETGKLITADQIEFLINHAIRTVKHGISSNKKPYMLNLVSYNMNLNEKMSKFQSFIDKIVQSNQQSDEPLDRKVYENYIKCFENLLTHLKSNPKDYAQFKASLPILLDQQTFQTMLLTESNDSSKSNIQVMSNAIVNLNFSKENPDKKNYLKEKVNEYINGLAIGSFRFKILTNINFQATDIFGQSETWGYPTNNVDTSRFTLSYRDTRSLIESLEGEV
jgi:hypothetical protein